jgi:hypothetical protein
MVNKTKSAGSFLLHLWKQISNTVVLLVLIALVYIYLMQFLDHNLSWIPYLVISLALFKTIYFTFFTFRQVNKSIKQCHSFGQLLWVFGILVLLIIFSFAADFTCLGAAHPGSFKGTQMAITYAEKLFEYFYFSVVTFASIGYGDLVPVTVPARLLVILEIGQSFVMVVFGLSNINNIHTTLKNQ